MSNELMEMAKVASKLDAEISGREPQVVIDEYCSKTLNSSLAIVQSAESYVDQRVKKCLAYLVAEYRVNEYDRALLKRSGLTYKEKIVFYKNENVRRLIAFLLEAKVIKCLEKEDFSKQNFVKQVEEYDFPECMHQLLDIKKKYTALEELHGMAKDYVMPTGIEAYLAHYNHAIIFLKTRLNMLNRNEEKKSFLPKDKVLAAQLYFYEVKSEEELFSLLQHRKYEKNRSYGLRAEKSVAKKLEHLSGFVAVQHSSNELPGVKLWDPCHECFVEYDQILVSETGDHVICVEVKNLRADKLAFGKDGQLVRTVKGQKTALKNPEEQLDKQVSLLRNILGEGITVDAILCVANPYVLIEGMDAFAYPVVKGEYLLPYLNKKLPHKEVNIEMQKEVVRRIDEYRVDNRGIPA